MLRRFSLFAIALVALSACADPPGAPHPLPTDYQEQSKATFTYNKYATHLRMVEGVLTTYMTANNNPRQIVVVTRDEESRKAASSQFGPKLDGIEVVYKVQTKDTFDGEAEIQAVPTVEQPTTWWGRFVFLLRHWKDQIWPPAKP